MTQNARVFYWALKIPWKSYKSLNVFFKVLCNESFCFLEFTVQILDKPSWTYSTFIRKEMTMVLVKYGSSEHVAHIWSKKGLCRKKRTWRLFRRNQMPLTNRNTWFTPICAHRVPKLPSNINTTEMTDLQCLYIIQLNDWCKCISNISISLVWLRTGKKGCFRKKES